MEKEVTLANTYRACQIWAVLTYAASKSQIITYGELSKATGLAAFGMDQALGYIQTHCQERGLPALTALVVQKDAGEPESGFAKENACEEQMKSFNRSWSLDEANDFIKFVTG